MSPSLSRVFVALLALLFAGGQAGCSRQQSEAKSAAAAQAPAAGFELRDGDRVVLLGDTLAEREQYSGWIETMLTTRYADRNVTFRNLGWSADTPEGASRLGRSLLQAGHEPADEGWKLLVQQLTEAKPTVVLVGYGMADSFAGAAGLLPFKAAYNRLLDTIGRTFPNVRCVLVGPVPHETLGAPWPDAAPHDRQLESYDRAIAEIARARGFKFISLRELLPQVRGSRHLTSNGIHLTAAGYRVAAEVLEQALLGSPGDWRTSPNTEQLRQAIIAKNEWYFQRSRPSNMVYIHGFRSKEQGVNAAEALKFDELVAAEEGRIAQLRRLKLAQVPPVPLRRGNLNSQPVLQARPEFEVAEGMEVTLWAENPLLDKPVQMNFDPQGRLWVACTPVYPQLEPGQMATDKIVVLEDTTGSGRADKATIFADNLLLPLGVEPGNGGVYVAQSTDILFLRDTDGDGKADERQVILSGFGTEDTHHNLHTLRWGPDGRLYFNQSVYTRTDTETPHGVVRLRSGGIFRFDPRDQKLEVIYRGWANPWGHQFDAYGQSFVTDGAGEIGFSWGVPGASYLTAAGARRELQSISPGAYPKFCGLEILRSELFPVDWQGDLITGDFRANRVARFKVSDDGAGYVTKQMPDVLRTGADSFRPVDMKLGPDGALYIADWSNRIIQHGEVDFRDPRRDKIHGRIWRLAPKRRAALPKIDFSQAKVSVLLGELLSANSYRQESARRVLIERGAPAVLPELAAWTARQTADTALLQAAWLYADFNQPQAALVERLLVATDPGVRATATRLLPANSPGALDQLGRLVRDANPRVRLEAVRALGQIPSLAALDRALAALEAPLDPFLDYALWLTVNELSAPWLAAVTSGQVNFDGRERQLAFVLRALPTEQTSQVLDLMIAGKPLPRDGSGPWIELMGSAGTAANLKALVDQLTTGGFDKPAALRALAALDEAARQRKLQPVEQVASLGTLLDSPDSDVRRAAGRLAGAWGQVAAAPKLLALAAARDTSAPDRATFFTALREIGGTSVIHELQKLVAADIDAPVRREAILILASLDLQAALPGVLEALRQANPDEAPALWRALLGIKGAGAVLAAQLAKAPIPAAVAQAGLRPAREGNRHQQLVQVLLAQAGLSLSTAVHSPEEFHALAEQALAQGDPLKGELIYRRPELACVSCHAIGGVGGRVGPDLTSIGASAQPDYLVESILTPNAKVKEGYHSIAITTKSNQAFSGVMVRETATAVVLRATEGQEISIPLADIAERTSIGSLMPAGLIDSLLPEERLDLFKFLSLLGKPGTYDAAKRDTARFWRLYKVDGGNMPVGTAPVIRGDFSLRDWKPAATLVNGVLPRAAFDDIFGKRDLSRGLFAATRFQSAQAGPATFTCEGEIEAAWLNGQEIKPGSSFAAQVSSGPNVLVVRFKGGSLPERLQLRSTDVTFLPD